jgi:hypothetical protein
MPRRKKVTGSLAALLVNLAAVGEQTEQAAGSLLRMIESQNIRDVKAFDAAIVAAYTENGWNAKPGRPSVDSDRRVVPHTVRTYVWEVRSALREGLPVWTFQTFYVLRMARKAKKEQVAGSGAAPSAAASAPSTEPGGNGHPSVLVPEDAKQDFEGVRIGGGAGPNGALFHDLMVCYLNLRPEDRALLGRQLARLLHKYQPQIVKAA